ncbi:MAG: hypothetical protein JSR12_05785 [Bacteroidetes bacterium]|nr:hypothetical protein [Bacteroidota bacterium]
MTKKIKLIIILTFIGFFSCRSVNFKRDFINKKTSEILIKYSRNGEMVMPQNNNIAIKLSMNEKVLKPLSMHAIKTQLKKDEYRIALTPDSTSQYYTFNNVQLTDSFYFNKNKIKYIKSKHLTSVNMHLYKE